MCKSLEPLCFSEYYMNGIQRLYAYRSITNIMSAFISVPLALKDTHRPLLIHRLSINPIKNIHNKVFDFLDHLPKMIVRMARSRRLKYISVRSVHLTYKVGLWPT